jgi:hypothetical protein
VNDLRALHLIHSAIKYYQVLGATPEIRDELLTVASRAIGTKPQTLSAAICDIEIKIAKLKNRNEWAKSTKFAIWLHRLKCNRVTPSFCVKWCLTFAETSGGVPRPYEHSRHRPGMDDDGNLGGVVLHRSR